MSVFSSEKRIKKDDHTQKTTSFELGEISTAQKGRNSRNSSVIKDRLLKPVLSKSKVRKINETVLSSYNQTMEQHNNSLGDNLGGVLSPLSVK